MQLINLVFVDSKTAKSLNKKYRGQDYIPTVLSFCYNGQALSVDRQTPRYLDKNQTLGEIVICLEEAKKQNLKLATLVNHGLRNLLSEIPAKEFKGA